MPVDFWDSRCPPAIVYVDLFERLIDGQVQHLFVHIETGALTWRNIKKK